MSNSPILPIIPGAAGIVGGSDDDDDKSKDDRETVDEDVREAGAVNDNLEE